MANPNDKKQNPVSPIIDAINRITNKKGVVQGLQGNVYDPARQKIKNTGEGWYYFKFSTSRVVSLASAYETVSSSALDAKTIRLNDENTADLSNISRNAEDLLLLVTSVDVQRESYARITINVDNADIVLYKDNEKIVETTDNVSQRLLFQQNRPNTLQVIIRKRENETDFFGGFINVEENVSLRLSAFAPPAVKWADANDIAYDASDYFDRTGIVLAWEDSPFVGGWVINRTDYKALGPVISYILSGTTGYTYTVSGTHSVSSGPLVIGGSVVGVVNTWSSGTTNTTINVLSAEDEDTGWTGQTVYSFQSTSIVAEATRDNVVDEGDVILFLDSSVSPSQTYSYRVAAWSLIDSHVIGPYSTIRTQQDLTKGYEFVPQISEQVGENSYDITINDPQLRITAVEFKRKDGPGDFEATWQTAWDRSTGVAGTDAVLTRGEDLTLSDKHNVGIKIRVTYTDASGGTDTIERSKLFDIDETAEISDVSVSFSGSDDVLVTADGDDDVVRIVANVGINAEPSDPTGTGDDIDVASAAIVEENSAKTAAGGDTIYVRIRGENSASVLGPVRKFTTTRDAGETSNSPPDSVLEGYWPMDETDGTLIHDFSGNARDSDSEGVATTRVTGVAGQCLSFPGLGAGYELLSDTEADAFEDLFYVSFWIKVTTTTGDQLASIISRDPVDQWALRLDQSQAFPQDLILTYQGTDNLFTREGVIEQDKWHFILAQWDMTAGTVELWVGSEDGDLIKQFEASGLNAWPANASMIGLGSHTISAVTSNDPFEGLVDDIRVGNVNLERSQVLNLMNNPGTREGPGSPGADKTSDNPQDLSWLIADGIITAGSLDIDAANEQIRINANDFDPSTGGDGIILGYDSTDLNYQLRVGNSSKYMWYDGNDLIVNGGLITSPASGSSPSILGWSHDIPFGATDSDTVFWSSGTITLQNGDTYSITSGNTGDMTGGTNYIYLDTDISTTQLQVSTTASDSVGNNRILIAVARAVVNLDAIYVVYGGSGGSDLGVSPIVYNTNIVNNSVTTDKINNAAVTVDKLNDSAVTTAKINNAAVQTAKLGNLAVTTAKIDDAAVVTAKILDDAVTFDKVAANAIGTKHLFVGSFDNLVLNPSFEQNGGSLEGWSPSTLGGGTWSTYTIGRSGSASAIYDPSGQSANDHLEARTESILSDPGGTTTSVAEGDEIYGEVYVRKESTGTANFARITLYFYDEAGLLTNSVIGNALTSLTTSWQKATVTGTAGTNAAYVLVKLRVDNNGNAERIIFDDVYVRKRLEGSLIVDGAITTDHLSANSVTAGKIEAHAIGVQQLFVGSYDNLIHNPGFEQNISTIEGWSTTDSGGSWAMGGTNHARSGARGVKYTTTGQTSNAFLKSYSDGDPTNAQAAGEGDRFYVETYTKKVSTGTVNDVDVVIEFVDENGSSLSTSSSSAITPTTSFQKISHNATAPAGTAFVNFWARVYNQGNTEELAFDDFYARRMVEGSIVVDGTITADHIAANTITAAEIGARAIAARHLFVGSFDNLVANPGFEQDASSLVGWSKQAQGGTWTLDTDAADVRSGTVAARYEPSGQTAAAELKNYTNTTTNASAATEGDQFYMEAYARKAGTGTPNNVRVDIEFYDESGTPITQSVSSQLTPTQSYQKMSTTGTAPAGTAYVIFTLTVLNGGNSEPVLFDDVYARRMVEGSIVVDGTITTNHLEANSITSGKIEARAIQAKHLFVGSFDNLVRNPGFEQTTSGQPDEWTAANSVGGTWGVSTTSRSGGNALSFDPSGQTGAARFQNSLDGAGANQDGVAAAEGDQFYLELYARKLSTGAANQVYGLIRYRDENGTNLSSHAITPFTPTTTFTKGSVNGTAPAGTAQVVFECLVANDGNTETVLFDDVYARRMVQGSIVVDGTIQAQHIQAGTITANEIDANTITFNEIAGNTITAGEIEGGTITGNEIASATIKTDNLIIGSTFERGPQGSTNLFWNGGFEQGDTFWTGAGTVQTNATNAHSGNNYLERSTGAATISDKFQENDDGTQRFIEVSEGDVVEINGWVYRSAGDAQVGLIIAEYDKDVNSLSSWQIPTTDTGGSWIEITGSLTVGANTKYIKAGTTIRGDGTVTTTARWDDLRLTVKLQGVHIADGVITADHISVTSLSAIEGNMGTLDAGSIVIGTTNKIWLNDSDDGALNIGGSTKGSAPFRVTAAGDLTATSATITGTIESGSNIKATNFSATGTVTFAGNVTVEAGSGNTAVRVYTSGGGHITFHDTSGVQQALVGYATTPDEFVVESESDLILRAGGSGNVHLDATNDHVEITTLTTGTTPSGAVRWLEIFVNGTLYNIQMREPT